MLSAEPKTPVSPLGSDEFAALLGSPLAIGPVAVAFSGGPDSMALAWLLAGALPRQGAAVLHALTVDHGLRQESAHEAADAGRVVAGWPGDRHEILTLATPPARRVMEEARSLRYAAMADYCRAQGISSLYLAHHLDDQAETFLFRLAKGSGIDGLAAMRSRHPYSKDLLLVRPLLSVPKDRLIATCLQNGLPFIRDPSNADPRFARARLRDAAPGLAQEGLTPKRLAVTAHRMNRAAAALDHYAGLLYDAAVRHCATSTTIDRAALLTAPAEIQLRVLLRALGGGQRLRREKVEIMSEALAAPAPFRRQTLGGFVISRDDAKGRIIIEPER